MMRRLAPIALTLALATIVSAAYAAPRRAGKARAQQQPSQASPNWWGKAPGATPNPNNFRGTVESINAQSITVKNPEGARSFTITDKTRVLVKGQKATIGDIKVGDPVVVRVRLENNVPVAAGILVPKPSLTGQIASISGNVIVLQNKKTNAEYRVTVSDQTKYRSHGYQGTLADLRAGYKASAVGNVTNNEMTADAIEFIPDAARGTVTVVNGNTVTLQAVRQATVNAVVTPATAITVRPRVAPNRKGTIEDIKAGTPANIGYIANPNGAAQLLWIDLLTGS